LSTNSSSSLDPIEDKACNKDVFISALLFFLLSLSSILYVLPFFGDHKSNVLIFPNSELFFKVINLKFSSITLLPLKEYEIRLLALYIKNKDGVSKGKSVLVKKNYKLII